ncbi:gas vesicle protein GvpM [Halorubrum sp. Hd13]|uniref:gas vesicle protein GvpM n=1 Tax=Halorubrum sp. Hd13 TaxID=1480728 RepID=UPI000B981BF4|nr:gas vesicle protein [Halorubrum sp. Hd13]OYR39575.1 gas vesicle protein GvpM [Halorubrum sp. Hd13]
MRPTKSDDDALVDLVDAVLRTGAVVEADVVITVADVPLVGLKLRAALAGMKTMTEHGVFEEWDEAHRLGNSEASGERVE